MTSISTNVFQNHQFPTISRTSSYLAQSKFATPWYTFKLTCYDCDDTSCPYITQKEKGNVSLFWEKRFWIIEALDMWRTWKERSVMLPTRLTKISQRKGSHAGAVWLNGQTGAGWVVLNSNEILNQCSSVGVPDLPALKWLFWRYRHKFIQFRIEFLNTKHPDGLSKSVWKLILALNVQTCPVEDDEEVDLARSRP